MFLVRAAETCIGLTAMLVLLAVAPDLAHLAPYCIGFGGLRLRFPPLVAPPQGPRPVTE